jgi:hypothetical protein
VLPSTIICGDAKPKLRRFAARSKPVSHRGQVYVRVYSRAKGRSQTGTAPLVSELRTMLRLFTDQNFNGRILRGLRCRVAEVDLVRAFDAGLELGTRSTRETLRAVPCVENDVNRQSSSPSSCGSVSSNNWKKD